MDHAFRIHRPLQQPAMGAEDRTTEPFAHLPVEPAWPQPALGDTRAVHGMDQHRHLAEPRYGASSGAPLTGTAGTLGQLAILLGATATAAVFVRYTDGLTPYAAAAGWALGGAALGAYGAGANLLAAAAAAGLTVVLVGFAAEQLHRRRVAEA